MLTNQELLKIDYFRYRIQAISLTLETIITERELFDDLPDFKNTYRKLAIKREELIKELNENLDKLTKDTK